MAYTELAVNWKLKLFLHKLAKFWSCAIDLVDPNAGHYVYFY